MLTFVILAKNEGHIIGDTLASLDGLGEILLIDDESTDNTAEVALRFKARVLSHRLENFAAQRNWALQFVETPWVFFLDADEHLTPYLRQNLIQHLQKSPPTAASIKRQNFALGQKHRFGPLKPDWVTRLFPKDSVHWVGDVHERAETPLRITPLSGLLIHYTYCDWEHYLKKQYRYAAVWAKQAHSKGKKTSVIGALGKSFASFVKMMVLNGGVLGGPLTWALCYYYAGYTLTKYLKLNELQKSSPPDNVA